MLHYAVNGLPLIDALAGDFDAFAGRSDGSIETPARPGVPCELPPEIVTGDGHLVPALATDDGLESTGTPAVDLVGLVFVGRPLGIDDFDSSGTGSGRSFCTVRAS